jgi:hypothetical protein
MNVYILHILVWLVSPPQLYNIWRHGPNYGRYGALEHHMKTKKRYTPNPMVHHSIPITILQSNMTMKIQLV